MSRMTNGSEAPAYLRVTAREWQSPGAIGNVLAAFASGATVDANELADDVERTITHDKPEPREVRKLRRVALYALSGRV